MKKITIEIEFDDTNKYKRDAPDVPQLIIGIIEKEIEVELEHDGIIQKGFTVKLLKQTEVIQDVPNKGLNKEDYESLKDMVLKESAKGNIVIASFDGFKGAPLKEFIKQPIEGMLYDLNRNESVILTFIEDIKWVNDYAMTQVIRYLKGQADSVTGTETFANEDRLIENWFDNLTFAQLEYLVSKYKIKKQGGYAAWQVAKSMLSPEQRKDIYYKEKDTISQH